MIPAGDDMKYKLIVSDLDGTLLNGQMFVSNINKEVIRCLFYTSDADDELLCVVSVGRGFAHTPH